MSKGTGAGGGETTAGCIVLVLIILAIGSCFGGGKDSEEDVAKKAADKQAGFHCLSGWDGSHREFVGKVKDKLRDPGSFEHYETRVGPNQNGRHSITMEFGAKNGFGGMNRDIAMGTYDHETCAPSDPVIIGQ